MIVDFERRVQQVALQDGEIGYKDVDFITIQMNPRHPDKVEYSLVERPDKLDQPIGDSGETFRTRYEVWLKTQDPISQDGIDLRLFDFMTPAERITCIKAGIPTVEAFIESGKIVEGRLAGRHDYLLEAAKSAIEVKKGGGTKKLAAAKAKISELEEVLALKEQQIADLIKEKAELTELLSQATAEDKKAA